MSAAPSPASPAPPVPVVIDTDPGIDDAMAILAAFADPALAVRGLTTIFGNVSLARATVNALALVELAGLAGRVPVAAGAARPLVRSPAPHPDFVHGGDGFGVPVPEPRDAPDRRDAADFLAAAEAEAGRLVVVALGPLTNIAEAAERHPGLPGRVARLVVMGGAVRHPGNVTPSAEANFWQDPDAAEAVLAAGWPLTLVGLDVTECVRVYPDDLAALPEGRATGFLRAAMGFYARFHGSSRGFDGCYLHDPTAVAAAADPRLLETRPMRLAVATGGEETGAVRAGAEGHEAAVGVAADAVGIRARILGALASGRLP